MFASNTAAEGHAEQLPVLASELVGAQVAVISAFSPPAALAAKAATATTPVVFASGEDPVKLGLVASYNRPGGNITGIAVLIDVLSAKRLGLLRDLVPTATLITALLDPSWSTFETQLSDVQEAARAVGQQIHVLRASTDRQIDTAFAQAKELRAGAMLVGPSTFFTFLRQQIVALAARDALPTIYGQREFMAVGGLMSDVTDLADAYRQAGVYRENSAAPNEQSCRCSNWPNSSCSSISSRESLGVKVSEQSLSLADEVIE